MMCMCAKYSNNIGVLGAPTNVTVDFRNETIIHLTWLPPFSLKDILSYSIIVLSSESGNEIETRNTTFHNFTYTWRPSFGYCNTFIFQIAAVNAIGMGNRTSGIVAGFLRRKLRSVTYKLQNS